MGKILDGNEICAYCGKRADEIPGFTQWRYGEDGNRYCHKHGFSATGGKPDYVTGNLDINSSTGQGRIGELLIAKVLNIEKNYDCNIIDGCKSSFDLYHDEYKKIDVKTRLFNFVKNNWQFTFNVKKEADTYICIGLSSNGKDVKHVWIVPNEGYIKNRTGIGISDTYKSLLKNNKWEVDSKSYNDVWKNLSLSNCSFLVDKKKVS